MRFLIISLIAAAALSIQACGKKAEPPQAPKAEQQAETEAPVTTSTDAVSDTHQSHEEDHAAAEPAQEEHQADASVEKLSASKILKNVKATKKQLDKKAALKDSSTEQTHEDSQDE